MQLYIGYQRKTDSYSYYISEDIRQISHFITLEIISISNISQITKKDLPTRNYSFVKTECFILIPFPPNPAMETGRKTNGECEFFMSLYP